MARVFELQGHRGARGLFPENTLDGFVATAALGVDALELDVAITADDVPVVFHDVRLSPDLVRGPDGAWLTGAGPAIRSLDLATVLRFDVGRIRPGSRYAATFARQAPRDGARIPTLAAVFAATPGVQIEAELKTLPAEPGATVPAAEMAERVVDVAEAAGAMGRLVVRSFDWRGLRHLRLTRPDLRLAWLTSPETEANPALWWDRAASGSVPQAVAAASREGGVPGWVAVWAPAQAGLTRAELAEAHALGLRVIPWTVNAPADLARLISWGVDGVCTDFPGRARRALHAAGLGVRSAE
jgi:glycerophosphoryl diester phosphodiesterase